MSIWVSLGLRLREVGVTRTGEKQKQHETIQEYCQDSTVLVIVLTTNLETLRMQKGNLKLNLAAGQKINQEAPAYALHLRSFIQAQLTHLHLLSVWVQFAVGI